MNTSVKPKIAVVGAGAVGSLLGGLLAKQGNDVTLIGRREHIERINRNGLSIDGVSGKITVSVPAFSELTFKPDIIFLAVKLNDLESICRQIAPLANDVPVCTLQNGIRGDAIAKRFFGANTIIGGIVLFNAQYLYPGKIIHGSNGVLCIGDVFGVKTSFLETVQRLLDPIVETHIHQNIVGARWTKLLVNIFGNTMDAMTGVHLGTCMKSKSIRIVVTRILKETLLVVNTSGVRLSALPGVPIGVFKAIIQSPLPVSARLLQYISRNSTTVSSTLQSLKRGRTTEIEYLNGEIVSLGKTMHIETPYNSAVVKCIHDIERTGEFYSFDQINQLFTGFKVSD